jgi:GT2 family glycosyltransferase
VLRRALIERVGGFSEDPRLIAWEDYDAWLRVAKVTERFERLDKPLGYYWSGGANLSSPRRLIANLARFIELYGRTGPISPESAGPAWYHYSLGLAHYRLGSYAVVPTHMRRALLMGLPTTKRVKAVFIAVISLVRACFHE